MSKNKHNFLLLDEDIQKIDVKFFEKIYDVLINNLQDHKKINDLGSLNKFLISDEILPPYQLSQISTFSDIILFFILIVLILNI